MQKTAVGEDIWQNNDPQFHHLIFTGEEEELGKPPSQTYIEKARLELGNDFMDAFVKAYTRRGRFQYSLRMGVYPNNGIAIESSSDFEKNMVTLLSLYEEKKRDLYVSWLYFFFRNQKERQVEFIPRIHYLTKVLCWKGLASWRYPIPNAIQNLDGGERRGLMIIAMARNRSRGQSVFAQFSRDLLKLLFHWIQWSLPLDF